MALVYLISFSAATIDARLYAPRPVLVAGYVFGLNQHWVMFRQPGKTSHVFEVRGLLENRQTVDLIESGDADWKHVRDMHRHTNFRTYYRRLEEDWYDPMRTTYARWICREWNADPTRTRLVGVQMDVLRTPIPPPGVTPGRTIRGTAWRRPCE